MSLTLPSEKAMVSPKVLLFERTLIVLRISPMILYSSFIGRRPIGSEDRSSFRGIYAINGQLDGHTLRKCYQDHGLNKYFMIDECKPLSLCIKVYCTIGPVVHEEKSFETCGQVRRDGRRTILACCTL